MSFHIDEEGRYTEVHFNPDYPKEFRVKLPTKREYGVNPQRWLTYTIKPYDVNSKCIQCLEPTEDAPGLSIRCALCGKEMVSLIRRFNGETIHDNGLLCFMCTHVTAPRFCLEALARAAYEKWEIEYDYEAYVRKRDELDRSYARVAAFMERWANSISTGPKYRFVTRMAVTEDNRIVYVVSREEATADDRCIA